MPCQCWKAWRNNSSSSRRPGEKLASRFVDGLLRHFGSGREYLFWCERDGRTLAMCIRKNRSRAWCDMTVCGNRAKASRHYRRKKEEMP